MFIDIWDIWASEPLFIDIWAIVYRYASHMFIDIWVSEPLFIDIWVSEPYVYRYLG